MFDLRKRIGRLEKLLAVGDPILYVIAYSDTESYDPLKGYSNPENVQFKPYIIMNFDVNRLSGIHNLKELNEFAERNGIRLYSVIPCFDEVQFNEHEFAETYRTH